METEYLTILNKYASDGIAGSVITGTPNYDIKLTLPWTQSTWEDGIPVNKYFSRCEDELCVTLKKGVEIAGVHWRGLTSGCHMFCFRYNDIWFEAKRYDAEMIMEALHHPVETVEE